MEGLTAGFAKNESSDGYRTKLKQATDSQGGEKSHSRFGQGGAWWGGCGNDQHNDGGGGSGWYGGGQGRRLPTQGGGVGY